VVSWLENLEVILRDILESFEVILCGILTGEFWGYSPSLEANSGSYETGHDHFRILSSLLTVIERIHFIDVGSVKENSDIVSLLLYSVVSLTEWTRLSRIVVMFEGRGRGWRYYVDTCLAKQHSMPAVRVIHVLCRVSNCGSPERYHYINLIDKTSSQNCLI